MHYTGQDMLWLIGSLSRVFRMPFDAQLIRQKYPPPYSRISLISALHALDFKVGEMQLDEEGIATLERIPFPVVAFAREDEAIEPAAENLPDAPSDSTAPQEDAAASENTQPPDGEEEPAPKSVAPVLLIKADAERVLFFRAGAEQLGKRTHGGDARPRDAAKFSIPAFSSHSPERGAMEDSQGLERTAALPNAGRQFPR